MADQENIAELFKSLPEETQDKIASSYQEYLGRLPQQAYTATLTRLTNQFGPEFASSLVQPRADIRQPVPAPEAAAPEIKEPELKWYEKPIAWAAEQPVLGPAMEKYGQYVNKWMIPAAMTVSQPLSPQLRKQLSGRSPFDISPEERTQMWEEGSKLPWLIRTGAEMAVDPLSYVGWGIPGMAQKVAGKAGMKTVAKMLQPVVSAEEAYIKAASLPIKAGAAGIRKFAPAMIPDIAEFRATGKLVLRKPLEESPRTIAKNMPIHTYDALVGLADAGGVTGKPLSQVLQDFRMGIPDQELAKTITNPKQQRALAYLQKNADKLDLDMYAGMADRYPQEVAAALGVKQTGFVAKELGLPEVRIDPKLLRMANKLYSTWKSTVLQSPFFVVQNTVENPLRELLDGIIPTWDMVKFSQRADFLEHPKDIQRRLISLAGRWNKDIPEYATLKFSMTPETGAVTEAMTGAIAMGKSMPASTAAAFMDDVAIVNTYFTKFDRFVKALMEKNSPETAKALADIKKLYADAARVKVPEGFNVVNNLTERGGTLEARTVTKAATGVTKGIGEVGNLAGRADVAIRNDGIMITDINVDKAFRGKDVGTALQMEVQKLAHESGKPVYAGILSKDGEAFLKKLQKQGLIKLEKVPSGLAKIEGADVSVSYRIHAGPGTVDQKLLEDLERIAITGTTDDYIKAISAVMHDKTLAIARPMSSLEKGLPDILRSRIRTELPRLWAKDDIKGIERMFTELERTLPQYIETYQKQMMASRLRAYRDLLKAPMPKQYRSFLTKTLNKFRYNRISEAETRILNSKSLSEFERALFQAQLTSRRELEELAEWHIFTEITAKNAPPESLASWLLISDRINDGAFKAGDELVEHTFKVSNTIKHSKDQVAIQQAWDNYIREIQGLVPDVAESMAHITPDADVLWSSYHRTQEQRWFNVGQEKLTAAKQVTGVDINTMPKSVDANGKLITQADYMQSQRRALNEWKDRVIDAFDKRHVTPTARNQMLSNLREQTLSIKESIALQTKQLRNQAKDMAMDSTYSTFGNYAQRTNLDEFMTGIGAPFWFFPSRSIPFYTTQLLQHPRLGIEVANMQNEAFESEQPARLFGTINIPGTNYYYNPLSSTMLWQLTNPMARNFMPAGAGGLEQGDNWLRNNLGISLGPQWKIATAIVERIAGRQTGETVLTAEPQAIIPQQRWLDAVAGLKLPVISPIAQALNEPFDMYLRAVYGDTVANWSKREVEKTIVDMGYNPQTATDEIIKAAWDKYYIRQLLSIPGGAVKELTPTEKARYEAINQKAKELGLTSKQRITLRELGESPFVGMRQDQIEAIYADIPASKLWRYIRPSGLNAKSRPIWEDYIQLKLERETLLYGSDPANPTKGSRLYNEQQYDKALRTNRITPREWKSLYRQNYADYMSKVEQLEKDFPLAPRTEADWEAYRKLMDWDTPVRHLDDVKLDAYYDALDSAIFENDIGEFDYDAYRAAEQQFFAGLPQETIDYIKSRKDKYKTPLRFTYSRDMEKAQMYYSLQDAVLAQYPPEIKMIVEYALTMPDYAIQKAILAKYPTAALALRKARLVKEQYRKRNPEIDRILRYWSS